MIDLKLFFNIPGEKKQEGFNLSNNAKILTDKAFADGAGKVIFFSIDGKLLKEIKMKWQYLQIVPIGDNFVAVRMPRPGKKGFFINYHMSLFMADP